MGDFIDIDDVRGASGETSGEMTDAQIELVITEVEKEMGRWINTKFAPTEKIDVIDGTSKNNFFTRKNPLLSVRELKSDGTSVDVETLNIYRPSGKVSLDNEDTSSDIGGIFVRKQNSIVCKYIYGLLEESSTSTTTSADVSVGTSVLLTVASESGFSTDDWVDIYGMDGNKESTKITATASGSITVDQLVFDHESESTVVLLEIPEFIKRYMIIEASIAVALFMIGATYTFNASYSLGELSVVKGVPYLHWQSIFEKLIKEREMRRKRIRPRPSIVID